MRARPAALRHLLRKRNPQRRHRHRQLTSVSGEVATGIVTHTTDQALTPPGRITITLDPATDTITAYNISFCGPSAPPGNCGA